MRPILQPELSNQKALLGTRSLILLAMAALTVTMILAACSSDDQPEPPGGVDFVYLQPDNPRDSVVIEMTGVDSLTVLQLLQKAFKVKNMTSVQGAFVTHIDEVGGPDGYFWIYTVNDEILPTACDRVTPDNGDVIRWYYRHGGMKEE
ncbi:MAG TPA: DUF4430 domain-containing protein [candidate division Zixibacteria bacterium]|nr:DUF4430 domain-containing protein [candidate division Zixibacteria bacterium]